MVALESACVKAETKEKLHKSEEVGGEGRSDSVRSPRAAHSSCRQRAASSATDVLH